MPPRKPKQPARKAAPKKAASKKSQEAAPPKLDYNPDTHVRGEDGQLYEKKVISGTGTAAGVNTPKTNEHLELEAKMAHAIHQAHSEGVSDPKEIQKRILAAREAHLGNSS